jgi:3-dehydroquinate synthase
MVMAAELSVRGGFLSPADAERLRRLVQRARLPIAGPAMSPERYLALMAGDKKAAAGRARFVVLRGPGRAELRDDLSVEVVRAAIAATTAASPLEAHQ